MQILNRVNADGNNVAAPVDFWLLLLRHRIMFFGLFSLTIVTGGLVALLKPPLYEYSTGIELGTRIVDGQVHPIETPETVVAKLKESYIPQAVVEFFGDTREARKFRIVIEVPDKSQLVIVKCWGTRDEGEQIKALLTSVAAKIKADHEPFQIAIRKEAEIHRSGLKNRLEELEDRAQLLQAERQRLNTKAVLLREQLEHMIALERRIEDSRDALVKGHGSLSVSFVLFDNESRRIREDIALINERLHVVLPKDVEQLEQLLASNMADQQELHSALVKANAQLNSLQSTSTAIEPVRTFEPVGMPGAAIFGLFLAAGVFLSFFVVVVQGIWETIRQKNARPRAVTMRSVAWC